MTILYGVFNPNDEKEFAPRQPTHTYPVSRDWETIDCKATSCIYNMAEKCTVPSLAKINEDGKCEGFKRRE